MLCVRVVCPRGVVLTALGESVAAGRTAEIDQVRVDLCVRKVPCYETERPLGPVVHPAVGTQVLTVTPWPEGSQSLVRVVRLRQFGIQRSQLTRELAPPVDQSLAPCMHDVGQLFGTCYDFLIDRHLPGPSDQWLRECYSCTARPNSRGHSRTDTLSPR